MSYLDKDNRLETGPVGEGGRKVVPLTLTNPTDGDVEIKLFLGTERMTDLWDLYDIGMKKMLDSMGIEGHEDKICLSHANLELKDLKYFAEALFNKVTFFSSRITKGMFKVCFKVGVAPSDYEIFFQDKVDCLFEHERVTKN